MTPLYESVNNVMIECFYFTKFVKLTFSPINDTSGDHHSHSYISDKDIPHKWERLYNGLMVLVPLIKGS